MRMIRHHLAQVVSVLLLLPFAGLPGAGRPFGVAAVGPSSEAASTSPITHVFVIVMENHSNSQVWGTSSTPYITSLGKAYARASNYYATSHPSLPNYLQMIAGSNYGITNDCSPSSSCHIRARSLADLLQAKGLRWKAYMESMPAPCGVKTSGGYAPKHNPFVYFDNIRTNPTRCRRHVVPLTAFSSDLGSLSRTPNFAFISPNLCNDMHDCTARTGDTWLKNHVPAILKSPACVRAKCLVVITWDEDNGHSGNHVLTIFAGSGARTGGVTSGTRFNHYSLLRTIEIIFHLPTQTTRDSSATAMTRLLR